MYKYLQEAYTAIVRNPFLSAVTILSICFSLVILNIGVGVNQLTQTRINELSEEVKLTVYVQDDVSEKNLEKAINELKKLKGVVKVTYTNADDALKKLTSRYPDSDDFLDEYKINNPLPATLSIATDKPESQQRILQELQNGVYKNYFDVDSKFEQRSPIRTIVNNLLKLKSFTTKTVWGITIIFIIGSSLLIFNAIKITLFNRKQEIQIMQLVGATHEHIRTPFIIEAVLFALAGFFISLVLLAILPIFLPSDLQSIKEVIYSSSFLFSLVKELILLIVIGVTTSIYTVNTYLNKRALFR